jgi:hypothetical protein
VSDVFSYSETKNGKVFISVEGRIVTRLAGKGAEKFLARAEGLGMDGLQELMRRATGNFKRGNER